MKTMVLWLFLAIGSTLHGQNSRGFQFVESSTGMNYPTWESGYTELEFADINMDGYIDILSIGDHGSPLINSQEHGIMVWFGDGTGTWSVQMTGNFGYGGIAIGDVNNDGWWDVGYGMHHNYSSTDFGNQLLEVALGDGTGTNWIPWDDGLATNGESWGLFGTDFADVDNDGDLDVGSNSFGAGSGLHVYINQGNGTWVQSFGILPGNSNMRFVFGDINNDGNADFIVTHDAGIAFFGDGTGNFTNADYNLPNYSFPMYGPDLGDVNNDGAQDLAYVNPSGGIMVWVFDPGSSQWINHSGTLPASGNYQEVQLCDFNMDGVMDLAAFGNAQLTVWSGTLTKDRSIIWTLEFNTITSNNGDCAAFRAGGDVDRNGYPDMTLVEKVGSWLTGKNHLKCFKESTPYSVSTILAVFPKGNEVFKQGSVQFTDWISAVPPASSALVRIEYSLQGNLGPWTPLTPGTANSGRFQWVVPQTISSNNCFLRYTLAEADDTLDALTPQAFTILGEEGIVADFMADQTLTYPDSLIRFTDQSLGLITSWAWDFDNNDTVDATLRNPSYAYPQPGVYTVKLTVSDGTSSQTEIKTGYITVIPHVAIPEKSVEIAWTIFPNPCSGMLFLRYRIPDGYGNQESGNFGKGYLIFEIFEVSGNPVGRFLIGVSGPGIYETELDLRHLHSGIYLYRLKAGDFMKTGKLIRTGD